MSESCPVQPNDNVIEHEQLLPAHTIAARASNGACAIAGINLNDYSLNPQQKGWGAHCTGPFSTVTVSSGAKVTVDSRIAELSSLIMNANIRQGYSYRAGDTGAYNCRYISGTTVWSNHAWGLAIDCNWNTNPQHSPLTTDRPGWEIARWNRFGFAWGGYYNAPTTPDAMHVEFMGTPAQASSALSLARSELGGSAPPPPSNPGKLAWILPAGNYVGRLDGPAECHGGDARYDSPQIRALVQNVLQWFIYHGCVPGVAASAWSTSSWPNSGWDAQYTDPVSKTWHDRFYPGQQYPYRIYSDDYNRLAVA